MTSIHRCDFAQSEAFRDGDNGSVDDAQRQIKIAGYQLFDPWNILILQIDETKTVCRRTTRGM
ncbi:hypothetical protein [Nocardia brasiliensis]|uniref:hypothetical protein n=1 Tax=Nocardia brasiliensis TaxID=37326 RepID=UPI00245460EC|nr:hypothetical protein [Nocardia brasiliensis]